MTSQVLIVEDDYNTAQLFETILARAGIPSRMAADGNEAAALLKEFVPDLVLLDLGLPGMDGRQMIEFIQSDPRLKKTRIVIVSAYVDLIHEVRHYGADRYLTKPISPAALVLIVKELLNK